MILIIKDGPLQDKGVKISGRYIHILDYCFYALLFVCIERSSFLCRFGSCDLWKDLII